MKVKVDLKSFHKIVKKYNVLILKAFDEGGDIEDHVYTLLGRLCHEYEHLQEKNERNKTETDNG